MEIPNGVRQALKALALVPATAEGLAVYVAVASDQTRPPAVRKRALFKGRLLGEQLTAKAARVVAAKAKLEVRKAAEIQAATSDGFESAAEHKRWLRGEIIPGKPLPVKVLSAKHGGALDNDPYVGRFSHIEMPEYEPPYVPSMSRSFEGNGMGPGRAPYPAVRKILTDYIVDRKGNLVPFVASNPNNVEPRVVRAGRAS